MNADLYFIVSKIVALGIRIETWLVLFLAFGFFAALVHRVRAARFWTGLALMLVLGIGAFPVGDWVTAPLENGYSASPQLPSAPKGVIVLGGAVESGTWAATGQTHFNEAGERLTETLRLAKQFPNAKIVPSGGGASLNLDELDSPTEAAAMSAFLTEQGIEEERITLEPHSRTTSENATETFALISPEPEETWILVTSAWHMRRAMAAFRAAGWSNIIAWPVDFTHPPGDIGGLRWEFPESLFFLNRALKEHVGFLGYRFSGRI